MPHRSSVPLYWRLKRSKYNLIGSKCKQCGKTFFPRRVLCTECRSRGEVEEFEFSGKGTILSWTIIKTPPEGFEKDVPYVVAIIQLEEGARMPAQVVGNLDNIGIGRNVRPVFRRLYCDGTDGLIHYGLKFELAG